MLQRHNFRRETLTSEILQLTRKEGGNRNWASVTKRSQSTWQVRSNWSLIPLCNYSHRHHFHDPPDHSQRGALFENLMVSVGSSIYARFFRNQNFSEVRNFRFPNASPAHLWQSFPTRTPYRISLFTKTTGTLPISFICSRMYFPSSPQSRISLMSEAPDSVASLVKSSQLQEVTTRCCPLWQPQDRLHSSGTMITQMELELPCPLGSNYPWLAPQCHILWKIQYPSKISEIPRGRGESGVPSLQILSLLISYPQDPYLVTISCFYKYDLNSLCWLTLKTNDPCPLVFLSCTVHYPSVTGFKSVEQSNTEGCHFVIRWQKTLIWSC